MAKEREYDYHDPVLLKECLHFLIVNKNGLYLDGTLGGGGHTAAILENLEPSGKLISFDKDPDAIDHCQKRFSTQIENGVLQLRNASFDEACSIKENDGKVSGLLLDLGVSSHQLDGSSRGISYRYDSELDMRFGTEGETAKDFLQTASEEELIQVFEDYGEDPYSKKIARRIIEVRRASSLKTTTDLKQLIAELVPEKFLYKTLSRIFQAIRIRVNTELTILEKTLNCIIPKLETGGRIVVISYHSLEDRIVKDIFKKQAAKKRPSITKEEKYFGNFVDIVPNIKLITKTPIVPTKKEIDANKRARSAKLRIAEKL
ncbi:16S rRNA (cytosine(1402)-N(4))-methyltransferase RsmH [bacterium]|nr:MAG: 16S rRNA (cytosine(1402)-N(4))-methyltransferase RsmH [bacterium]